MNNELHPDVIAANTKASDKMKADGFESVFEVIKPAQHRPGSVYTLWVHLESGAAMLTEVTYHNTIYSIVHTKECIENISA